MQEKEQEDEQDKVKDKDQEYGYDQEYELTSAVCLLISYKGYMFFNCFLLTKIFHAQLFSFIILVS